MNSSGLEGAAIRPCVSRDCAMALSASAGWSVAVGQARTQATPPQVFEALLAYLDSEDSANCSAPGATTRRYYMNDLTSAISAAKVAERPGVSRDVALFYIRVARERLERLSERYAGAALASRREQLLALSQMLANNAELMRAGKPVKPLDSWIKLAGDLDEDASRSLYDPDTLRAALARSSR